MTTQQPTASATGSALAGDADDPCLFTEHAISACSDGFDGDPCSVRLGTRTIEGRCRPPPVRLAGLVCVPNVPSSAPRLDPRCGGAAASPQQVEPRLDALEAEMVSN